MIEDSKIGLAAARAAGMRYVLPFTALASLFPATLARDLESAGQFGPFFPDKFIWKAFHFAA